jgi:hypothetical protein
MVLFQTVRPVEVLRGWDAIGLALGAGGKAAKRWAEEGAPVAIGDDGIPRAEKAELWTWYRLHYGGKGRGKAKG